MVLLPNALLLEKSTFDQKEAGFCFVFSLHYSWFSGILNKNCMSLGRSSPMPDFPLTFKCHFPQVLPLLMTSQGSYVARSVNSKCLIWALRTSRIGPNLQVHFPQLNKMNICLGHTILCIASHWLSHFFPRLGLSCRLWTIPPTCTLSLHLTLLSCLQKNWVHTVCQVVLRAGYKMTYSIWFCTWEIFWAESHSPQIHMLKS